MAFAPFRRLHLATMISMIPMERAMSDRYARPGTLFSTKKSLAPTSRIVDDGRRLPPREMTQFEGESCSMRGHSIGRFRVTLLSIAISLSLSVGLSAQETPRYAGATEQGFLLPNGWTLQPA